MATQILILFGVYVVAFVIIAIYLWRRFERTRVHIAIGWVEDQLDALEATAKNLSADDVWLIQQLRANARIHVAETKLRTKLRDVTGFDDDSKERKTFLRRLTRSHKNTNYVELRTASAVLAHVVFHLAFVNSKTVFACIHDARKHAARHLELKLSEFTGVLELGPASLTLAKA